MSKVYSTAVFSLHPVSCCWKLSEEALDCQRLVCLRPYPGGKGAGEMDIYFGSLWNLSIVHDIWWMTVFVCSGVGSGPVFVFSRGLFVTSYVVDGVLLVLVLKNSRLLKWCRLSYLDHISWSYFSRFFL